MKKLLLIILAVTLIFTFVSCDDIFTTGTENNQESADDIELNTHGKPTDTELSTNKSTENFYITIPETLNLEYNSIDEYNAMREEHYNGWHVDYEAIDYLGEFNSFCVSFTGYPPSIPDNEKDFFREYMYTLNDGQVTVNFSQYYSPKTHTYIGDEFYEKFSGDDLSVLGDNPVHWGAYRLEFSSKDAVTNYATLQYGIKSKKLEGIIFDVWRNSSKTGVHVFICINEDYDFSNEAINEFLNGNTIANAVERLSQRILHIPLQSQDPTGTLRDSDYEYIEYYYKTIEFTRIE